MDTGKIEGEQSVGMWQITERYAWKAVSCPAGIYSADTRGICAGGRRFVRAGHSFTREMI